MSASEHLRRWLAEGMTGCQFAKLIAQDRNRLAWAEFPGIATEANVSRVFARASEARLPAVAIFTGIRSDAELVEQLRVLAAGERWTITEEHPEGLDTDDVMVGMEWRVRDGLSSSPMGLAPFATMPVTRRAPYVCIAAWAGGHDNPHWKRYDPGIVHFLDTDLAKLRLTPTKYRSLKRESEEVTGELLSVPPDDARYYRRVAFRLHQSVRDSLRAFSLPR